MGWLIEYVNSRTTLFMIARKFSIHKQNQLRKIAMALQKEGMQFGYGYEKTEHGLWSQDLAEDVYEVLVSYKIRYEDNCKDWKFSDNTERRLDEFEKTKEYIDIMVE